MTNLFSYDFEAGVASGTVMTTSNSAFTNLVQSGWTFSNAHLLAQGGGSLAGRCAPAGTACQANAGLSVWAATTTTYFRFYLYVEHLPSASTPMLQIRNGSTVTQEWRITTTGTVQQRNNGFTQTAVSGAIATVGQYLRIEGLVNSSTNQAQTKIFYGGNVHGTTPDYDSGLVTSATGSLASTNFAIGAVVAATVTLHYDNFVVSNSGWIGPAVTTDIPPSASAGTDQTGIEPWSVVTLTGTASDSDGTIVSQIWSQVSGSTATLYGDSGLTTAYTSGAVAYYAAPATINGDTSQFKFTATDNNSVSSSDTVNVTTLPVTERAVIGNIEVPMRIRTN